ncbi:MAG TPA: YciI family protein [Candidatus Dormibacteraeota bacterium]
MYSRDAADAAGLRDDEELLEKHWSYMDGFAASMIARGPTLSIDRETATGSLHVLALPSVDAARDFVANEPNNCAGVYAEHSIWRFENLLGRSMWEFSRQPEEPLFLIVGRSHAGQPAATETLPTELIERLVLYGALTTVDGAEPVGLALALQAPDREAVDALIDDERIGLGPFDEVEVHNWEFGGRR